MPRLLKSTLLSLGLVTGVAVAASAQSVSSLPPAGGVVPGQSAITQPYGSTQSFYPKPGGNQLWKEERYQPSTNYEADRAQHPYSTSIGPKPGSHSSGVDQPYQASEQDTQPGRHPYSATGTGPRAN